MHKTTERVKNAYTHEVNNIYYYNFPTCNYVWNRYIVQYKKIVRPWRPYGCIQVSDYELTLKPLGGPINFLIIPNGHECRCEHE